MTSLRCAWIAVALAAVPRDVRADGGDTCVSAYENAQVAKKKGEYVLSKAELGLCTHACPETLAKDCAVWLREVEPHVSSIVIHVEARDRSKPLADLRIEVDSIVVPLEAESFEVDPGRHDIVVEASGMTPAKLAVDAPEGGRAEANIVLERAPAVNAVGAVAPRTHSPRYPFVVGGVGLAVAAAGGVLGIIGQVAVADMRATCGKTASCDPNRVDRVRTEWIVGGVLGGVGVATVATAFVLYFTAKPIPETAPAARVAPMISVSPSGAFGGIAVRY